jgi:tetratricopeptide (TPR) repeat protein
VRRSGAELPWAGLNEGLLEERLGHPEKALAAYEATATAFPNFTPAAQNLVRLWRRQGRSPGEVEQELRTRLARAEGVGLRVGLAEVLLAAGNEPGAEEECKKALKADEKNVPAMIALANAYAARKRLELARMVLENARQVDESDPAIWNRLGFVELALGNRPQAIDHFKAAAALRQDYPEAHANYGAILADADDFPAAVQELELAVRFAPRSAGIWLDLGNAYRGLQEFAKAEEAYGRALQLDPALNDARFNLAVLYLDVPKAGLAAVQRLEQGLGWFDAFQRAAGGRLPQGRGARARPREEAAGARGEGPAAPRGRGGQAGGGGGPAAGGGAGGRGRSGHAGSPGAGRRPGGPVTPAGAARRPSEGRRRQVKWIRSLVALTGTMLTISLASLARAESAAPATAAPGKERKAAPTKILRLEELKVEGRIHKPQAMFLMPRANLNIGELDRSEAFLPKVSKAVTKSPF